MTTYELKRNYRQGELCSTSALIKASILVETEATKMLTAQMWNAYDAGHKTEAAKLRNKIYAAGYTIASSGNMKRDRVFEVTA